MSGRIAEINRRLSFFEQLYTFYYSGNDIGLIRLCHSSAGRVSAAAHRNHPFNEPAYGSEPAPYLSGQTWRTDAHAAAGRLGLSAVPLDGLGAWQGRLKIWLRRAAAENPPRRASAPVAPIACRSNKAPLRQRRSP